VAQRFTAAINAFLSVPALAAEGPTLRATLFFSNLLGLGSQRERAWLVMSEMCQTLRAWFQPCRQPRCTSRLSRAETVPKQITSLRFAETLDFALAFGWRSGLPLRSMPSYQCRL
jgi:hypothetical protein